MNTALLLPHQTRQTLSDILTSSLASNVISLGGVSSMPFESWPQPHTVNDSRLIVLTLSAFRFQGLMCLFAVADHATVDLDDDHLQELANNLCGTFKRQLGRHIPVLGMSTPNRLQPECLPFLESTMMSSAGFDNSCYETLVVHCVDSRGVAFYVGLLLQGSLNIELTGTRSDNETTGELELF